MYALKGLKVKGLGLGFIGLSFGFFWVKRFKAKAKSYRKPYVGKFNNQKHAPHTGND